MKRLHRESKLTPAQQGCFEVPRPTEFLFDTQADPQCVTNLAVRPAYGKTLRRMGRALDQWQTETADQFPGEDKLTPDGFDRTTGERIIQASHPSFVSE